MESLLPLIIAIAISAIFSAKKKKKTGQPYPEEKTTLPESPWDDLIRELKGETKPARPEPQRPSSGQAPHAVPDERVVRPVLESVSPAPILSYDDDLPAEPIIESAPFSYDDQAVAEAEQRLKLAGYAASTITIAEPVQPMQPVRPIQSADSGATAGSGFFPDSFDARMAVVYAEVMKPKFQEY